MTLEPTSEEERDRRSRHAGPPLPRETPELVTATQVFNLTQLIDSEREESGCDLNTFTIYWVLKQVGVAEARATVPTLEDAFRRFPNHGHNADERRRLKEARSRRPMRFTNLQSASAGGSTRNARVESSRKYRGRLRREARALMASQARP